MTKAATASTFYSGVFWTLISLALSAFSLTRLTPVSKDYMNPFVKACTSGAPLEEVTGHDWLGVGYPIIDHFLCFITPFFAAVQQEKSDMGGISSVFVMGVFIASFIFAGIESLRRHANGFVLFFPIVFLVGQLTSIAAAFPLLFLPSYFLSSNRFSLIYTSTKSEPVMERIRQFGLMNSLDGVFCTAFSTWGLSMICLLPFYGLDTFRSLWITMFQFAPATGFLVTFFTVLYGANKDLQESLLGSKTAVKLYKIYGFVLFLAHVFNVYLVVKSPTFSLEFLMNIPSSSPLSASLFLLLDGLSLTTSLAIFILAEQGVYYLFQYLALSVLIGPGSAFLFISIEREERLAATQKVVHGTTASKKNK